MKNSIKIISAILVVFCLVFTKAMVFASTTAKSKATMTDVKNESATITFGQYGKFTKSRSAIDLNNKTIDIKLTVENDYVPKTPEDKDANIVFLLDVSDSVGVNNVTINGKTMSRKEALYTEAKTLADKLLDSNKKIKLGVVEFATGPSTSEGTEADAKILTDTLSDDKSTIEKAIDQANSDQKDDNAMGPRTDIEEGLIKSKTLIDTASNKDTAVNSVVLLTDGVPNTTQGKIAPKNYYTLDQFNITKDQIKTLKNNNIDLYSVLVSLDENTKTIGEQNSSETDTKVRNWTKKNVAEYVFGPAASPTGKANYYIEDAKITDTIENVLFSRLSTPAENPVTLTNVVITDYMPDYIVNNFDYALLSGTESKLDSSDPTKIVEGSTKNLTPSELKNISATVDKTNNSIKWTFDVLPALTLYTVTYRLSLKDEFDSSILNQDLHTNKDVEIDYNENDKPQDPKHSDKCPVVKLTVPEEPKNEVTPPDNTISPKPVPQTGEKVLGITVSAIALIVIAGYSFVSYRKNLKK